MGNPRVTGGKPESQAGRFFSQPVQAGEVAAVEAVIADILAIDKQIIALSEVAYQEAADGIRQLNYAHRAALAYEQGE